MFANSTHANHLKQGLSDQEHRRATIAWNLLHDWRISNERLASFSQAASDKNLPLNSWENIHSSVDAYYLNHVRYTSTIQQGRKPDFLESHNAHNHYSASSLKPLNPYRLLVNILPLNALNHTYDYYRSIFPSFLQPASLSVGPANAPKIMDFLDKQLIPLSDYDGATDTWKVRSPQNSDFLIRTLQCLGESINVDSLRYEPVWASFATDLQKIASANPMRWRELVGVPNSSQSQWLLFLRYPVISCRTQPLVRPTQLDAGTSFAEHFPNPPTEVHGRAMDIQDNRTHLPLPEFIHARVNLSHLLSNVDKSPIFECVKIPPQQYSEQQLKKAQKAHLANLAKHFPPCPSWITEKHPAE